MRYLAVDLGGKRTGLAVGDRSTLIATPLEVLEIPPGPRLIEAIRHTIAEHGPDAIVIGLPLNMDGSEGEASKQVRAFGSALAAATSLPVEFHDERLSSRAASSDIAGVFTRKGRKKRLDAVAAARILRSFLESPTEPRD